MLRHFVHAITMVGTLVAAPAAAWAGTAEPATQTAPCDCASQEDCCDDGGCCDCDDPCPDCPCPDCPCPDCPEE